MARKTSLNLSSVMKSRKNSGIFEVKTNSSLNFVFFNKSSTVEMRYLVILKKMIKKLRYGLVRSLSKKRSIFFLAIGKNFCYTKKSKNARMGKGKGKISRPAIRTKKFKPFIYFKGVYFQSMIKLSFNLSARTNLSLGVHETYGAKTFFGLGRSMHPYQISVSTRIN